MIVRLLVALGLVLTGLALLGSPAHACSCVATDVDRQSAQATHVFVGEVTGSHGVGRQLVHDIDVSQVYKGEVPEVAQLRSGALGAGCGLGQLPIGRSIAFFATTDATGGLTSQTCSGTTALTDELSGEMSAAMGDPAILNQNGEPTPHTGPSAQESGADSGGALLWPWLLVVLVVAVGAAARTARRTT